jgi:hypothetical protein
MHRNSPQMPGQALGEPLKKHARNPASLEILQVWKSCRFFQGSAASPMASCRNSWWDVEHREASHTASSNPLPLLSLRAREPLWAAVQTLARVTRSGWC